MPLVDLAYQSLTSLPCDRPVQVSPSFAFPADDTCFVWQVFHIGLPFLGPALKGALVKPSSTKMWRCAHTWLASS